MSLIVLVRVSSRAYVLFERLESLTASSAAVERVSAASRRAVELAANLFRAGQYRKEPIRIGFENQIRFEPCDLNDPF